MALTPNQTEKLQHLIDKRRVALLAELREDARNVFYGGS